MRAWVALWLLLSGCAADHLIGNLPPGAGDTAGFQVVDSPVGDNPEAAALGDVDGDGRLDLLVANAFRDALTVSVLRGEGDGRFSPLTEVLVAGGSTRPPLGLALGDVDGDGHLDLLVANQRGQLYRGHGDGRFDPVVELPGAPAAAALADLDGDGRLDIAAVSPVIDAAHVLMGAGDGVTFTARDYAVAAFPVALAVADLNNDRRLDLAVASGRGGGVSALLADPAQGPGALRPRADYPLPDGAWAVAARDLDRDRLPDLVVARPDVNLVTVLRNVGAGAFMRLGDTQTGLTPQAIDLGDLDGDGHADLAVANANGDTVSVLSGRGDGSFWPERLLRAGQRPTAVRLVDLNRDGRLDVLVACSNDHRVRALLQQP